MMGNSDYPSQPRDSTKRQGGDDGEMYNPLRGVFSTDLDAAAGPTATSEIVLGKSHEARDIDKAQGYNHTGSDSAMKDDANLRTSPDLADISSTLPSRSEGAAAKGSSSCSAKGDFHDAMSPEAMARSIKRSFDILSKMDLSVPNDHFNRADLFCGAGMYAREVTQEEKVSENTNWTRHTSVSPAVLVLTYTLEQEKLIEFANKYIIEPSRKKRRSMSSVKTPEGAES